jgi:hypothetical protein
MSSDKNAKYSDEEEIRSTRQIAESIFGINFDEITYSGSQDNLIGIKSKNILFSKRLDSRTYFIQDKRYGFNRELGFINEEKIHLDRCHRILEKLNISLSEIRKEKVVKEKTQEAELDKKTNTIKEYEIREGKNLAKLYRQIDGYPVWSSNLLLSLTKEKSIGFMQLHWPEIPSCAINEIHRLDYKIKRGSVFPEEKSSEIENMEAGIIHSPAMGFFMDIYPAIRIIFKPTGQTIGKKKVLYLDRYGKKIPTPRQIETVMDDKFQTRPQTK